MLGRGGENPAVAESGDGVEPLVLGMEEQEVGAPWLAKSRWNCGESRDELAAGSDSLK